MKKILLLNPPGKNLYIRDYYESKVSQANYSTHPIDLVTLSGTLRQLNCEIFLIDSIVQDISIEETLEKISKINPDFIISLVASVSWDEDMSFLKLMKSKTNCKLIVCGDVLHENPEKYIDEYDFFDAVITDFTSPSIIDYINNPDNYQKSNKILSNSSGSKETDFSGLPYHELFIEIHYRYPFITSNRYCSVLTEYGCPFKCTFCMIGTLQHKMKKVEDVIAELKYIKSLNVREIFFVDQTFGTNRARTKILLNEIINQKLDIYWFGFSRVDVLDEEMLLLMKKSGCHTLILGIESGNDKILSAYRKGYNKEDIRKTLAITNRLKIRTVGTFIFGLPDETTETAKDTLNFLKELPLDYASFSVAVPRAGTDLRKQAISLNLINSDFIRMDQSGTPVAMPTKHLTYEQVRKIRKQAVRAFYLRPKYLIRRIKSIRTFYELANNILNTFHLIRRTWKL